MPVCEICHKETSRFARDIVRLVRHYPLFCFGIMIAVAVVTQFIIFSRCSGAIIVNRYNILNFIVTESATSLMLLFILPGRCRWMALAIPCLAMISQVVNAVYFKYFRDIFAISDIKRIIDLDTDILHFAFDELAIWQLLLVASFTILLGFYIRYRKWIENSQMAMRWRMTGFTVSVLGVFFGFWIILGNTLTDKELRGNRFAEAAKIYKAQQASGINYVAKWGYSSYYLAQLVPGFSRNDLTQKDITDIKAYISRQKKTFSGHEIFAANRNKRLILIIVESWSSSTFHKKINGMAVTPFLDSLSTAAGTIFILGVRTQVRGGVSSDAHLMYNTGLYPLHSGCAANESRLPDMPTLARQLAPEGNSAEIFGEPYDHYSHGKTNKAWGYGDVICGKVFEDNHVKRCDLVDPILFAEASRYLDEHPDIKLLTLCTLGMHGDAQAYSLKKYFPHNTGCDYKRCKWLEMTSLFDRLLQEFIETLKSNGEYDKSVIVLASDHVPHRFRSNDPQLIPLMILNSGISLCSNEQIGQIDVFPTILEVMGILGDSPWPGFGESFFRKSLSTIAFGRNFDCLYTDSLEHPDEYEELHHRYRLSERMLMGSVDYPF